MPAKSTAQQKAAGAALSAKRGDQPESKLQGTSKSMEKSMSEKQLGELARTERRGKAEHKTQSRIVPATIGCAKSMPSSQLSV